MLLKSTVFLLHSIYLREVISLLNETNENHLISQMRVHFDNQIKLFKIPFLTLSKQLSLNVNDCLSRCVEISMNELVMHSGYWSWHYQTNVLPDHISTIEA